MSSVLADRTFALRAIPLARERLLDPLEPLARVGLPARVEPRDLCVRLLEVLPLPPVRAVFPLILVSIVIATNVRRKMGPFSALIPSVTILPVQHSPRVQAEPRVQQVQAGQQVQRVQAEPQGQRVQAEPQGQRVQAEPQEQRVQAEPQGQQVQAEPQGQRVQRERRVLRGRPARKEIFVTPFSIAPRNALTPALGRAMILIFVPMTCVEINNSVGDRYRSSVVVISNPNRVTAPWYRAGDGMVLGVKVIAFPIQRDVFWNMS